MTNKDNFENTFRSSSNKIRLSPAEKSWGRIERRLTRRKNRNVFSMWNVGIAASILLFISIGSLFYLNDASRKDAKALSSFQIHPLEQNDIKANIEPLDLKKLYADMKADFDFDNSADNHIKVN